LSQGPLAPHGYWYVITLDYFPAGATIGVSCHDSVDPNGFRTFNLQTDGSGHAGTQSSCYSNDGPDHWVVADGIPSNHVAWGSAPPPTSSSGGAQGGSGQPPATGGSSSAPPFPDPCIARYRDGGIETTHSIFGGSETDYDRTSSLYHQCEGWGAPEGLQLTYQMKCALIAAAATYAGPPVNIAASNVCEYGSAAIDFAQKDWLGAAGDVACGFFSDVFATGVGILAAGGSSESGPGAVAVGVTAYRAMDAFLKVACGGLLDGGASALGQELEAHHETHVALDVLRSGKCLRYREVFGYSSWSAVDC
jgi:hypothetical protein